MSTSHPIPRPEPTADTAAMRPSHRPAARHAVRLIFSLVATVGLAYDAYAHFDLAANYDAIKTSSLSQGELFRVEGAAAAVAALGLLVRPRRYTAAIALLVAAGGLAAILAYRYYNIKSFGPVPAMYEPVWYPEKTRTAYAEAGATLASAATLALLWTHQRQPNDSNSKADAPRRPRPGRWARRTTP